MVFLPTTDRLAVPFSRPTVHRFLGSLSLSLSASSPAIGPAGAPRDTCIIRRENFMCARRKRPPSRNLLSRSRPSLAHSAGSVVGGATGQARGEREGNDAHARPGPARRCAAKYSIDRRSVVHGRRAVLRSLRDADATLPPPTRRPTDRPTGPPSHRIMTLYAGRSRPPQSRLIAAAPEK